MQQAADLDVVGERGIALHQPQRIHLVLRHAHHDCGGPIGCGHYARHRRRGPVRRRRVRIRRARSGQPTDGQRLHRRRLLPAAHRRRAADRLHDLHVAGLAIEDARQRVPDLGLGRIIVAVQQRLDGQDERPCRVTRLQRPGIYQRLLDRMQLAHRRVQVFHGRDRVAVRLGRQEYVGGYQPAVKQHGSGAGLAGVRPVADAETALAPEHGAQRLARRARDQPRDPVQRDVDLHHLTASSTRRARVAARACRYSAEPRKSAGGSSRSSQPGKSAPAALVSSGVAATPASASQVSPA